MTVYAVDDVIAVGVPEIAPVEADNDSPVGNAGEIDQEVTVPPIICWRYSLHQGTFG